MSDQAALKKAGLRAKLGSSVRLKLLVVALLPMLVVLPLLLGLAINRWSSKFDNILISKVNGDLTIAHQYLQRILENSGEKIQAVGASADFAKQLENDKAAELNHYLDFSRQKLGFDFLYLVTASGDVIASSARRKTITPARDVTNTTTPKKKTLNVPPDNRSIPTYWPLKWQVVKSAMDGSAQTEIDIFYQDDLLAISPLLADEARIDLIPTKAAVPTKAVAETRGMIVNSATPVMINGRKAALVGGILLNRNLQFIDTINDIVYQKASLPEGSQGTATLFLEDVRVSTNVRLFENKRALGTRVSAEVRTAVLGNGKVWLDRAFVVNDWYISAYEPIVDSLGQRVGMLYVGFLERPFLTEKYTTLLFLLLVFLLVTAIAVPILLYWVRGIFKPLELIAATITDVESGDMSARTGPLKSGDEIGKVAGHLDEMLDLLQQRDQQLRNWAEELNIRVEERTHELKEANRQLEATTQQLVISEKLAAIGEITAGVAHEINNPVAVIQGNMDVIRESLFDKPELIGDEFRLIDDQVHSINLIVSKLLQFARPDEFAGYHEMNSVEDVLTDCLLLVQHLLSKTDIVVERVAQSQLPVYVNRTELQQVVINLIVNAVHSMAEGGKLTLRSYDRVPTDEDPGVKHEGSNELSTAEAGTNGLATDVSGVYIEIEDTGTGMDEDVLKRVFDPFFTTKHGEGTGLGLSISQTLISRMGGHISVKSTPGIGTVFTIRVPHAEPELEAD